MRSTHFEARDGARRAGLRRRSRRGCGRRRRARAAPARPRPTTGSGSSCPISRTSTSRASATARRRRARRAAPRSSSRARTTPPGRRTRCSTTSARRSTRSSSTRSTARAIVTAVKAANKAGIPVVAVQSNVNGGKTATFIAGREDHRRHARWRKDAVNFCKGKNPCEIGIVEGIRADQSGAEENKAFRAYVGKYPNIKIVGAGRDAVRPGEGAEASRPTC